MYEHLSARLMFGVLGLKETFTIYVNESHESLNLGALLGGKRADYNLISLMNKQRAIEVRADPKRSHSIQQCVETWI